MRDLWLSTFPKHVDKWGIHAEDSRELFFSGPDDSNLARRGRFDVSAV